MLRMDQQLGRPVLIEFWDFCRPNSMRTLPYLKAWHERYERGRAAGDRRPRRRLSRLSDPEAVRAAVARLEIPYAVVIDAEQTIWQLYDNLGWPARYLFDAEGNLDYYHYGEGAYEETELAIQELLDAHRVPLAPLRPEDATGAQLTVQSEDTPGPYSGPYEAGGVWAVLAGEGAVIANGRRIAVTHPGAFELISHPRSTAGVLELELEGDVECHAVCFTPGLA